MFDREKPQFTEKGRKNNDPVKETNLIEYNRK